MAKKSRGIFSRATRRLKAKEKPTATRLLKQFNIGEKVILKMTPYSRSNPHKRFAGKTGIVVEKRGEAYVVEVKDGKTMKKLIVEPINMSLVQ